MAGRPEFYFDGTYYRKRIKLQNGVYKDVRGKTKEETRSKIQTIREAEKLGIRFFFLTGGEPLMEREILERAARYQNSWFLVFTK